MTTRRGLDTVVEREQSNAKRVCKYEYEVFLDNVEADDPVVLCISVSGTTRYLWKRWASLPPVKSARRRAGTRGASCFPGSICTARCER